MALHRPGLGAGVLDTDNVRDAGDPSAPLRSRSLAVQVRVHAAATRDRVLLDTGAGISRLFFDITNFSKLTHAAQQCARALRADEFDRRLARRRRVRRRRRECGKRGTAPSSTPAAADSVWHVDRAVTRPALDLGAVRSFVIGRRRRAVRVRLARVAGPVRPSQTCRLRPRAHTFIHVHVPSAPASTFTSTFMPTPASMLTLMHMHTHMHTPMLPVHMPILALPDPSP